MVGRFLKLFHQLMILRQYKMVLPMLPNCYSNFPVYSVYIVNFEQINACWVVGTTHFLRQEIAEAYVGLCQVSMRSILGGRREGAVGSAWRPVRCRGRSGVLSDITHCALGCFFFLVLAPTPPPPTPFSIILLHTRLSLFCLWI